MAAWVSIAKLMMLSAKHNSTMDKVTCMISSLFNITSQDMLFHCIMVLPFSYFVSYLFLYYRVGKGGGKEGARKLNLLTQPNGIALKKIDILLHFKQK